MARLVWLAFPAVFSAFRPRQLAQVPVFQQEWHLLKRAFRLRLPLFEPAELLPFRFLPFAIGWHLHFQQARVRALLRAGQIRVGLPICRALSGEAAMNAL